MSLPLVKYYVLRNPDGDYLCLSKHLPEPTMFKFPFVASEDEIIYLDDSKVERYFVFITRDHFVGSTSPPEFEDFELMFDGKWHWHPDPFCPFTFQEQLHFDPFREKKTMHNCTVSADQ